jgi:hypothetical protein
MWHVFDGDARVGHIGIRADVPVDEHRGWHCGVYPGCDPGQATDGTCETFEEAKAEFELAWNRLRPTGPKRTSNYGASTATSSLGNT